MFNLDELRARIAAPDRSIAERTQRKLDAKTKPRRSLGRLEDMACQYAAIVGSESPELPKKAVVVMGAPYRNTGRTGVAQPVKRVKGATSDRKEQIDRVSRAFHSHGSHARPCRFCPKYVYRGARQC